MNLNKVLVVIFMFSLMQSVNAETSYLRENALSGIKTMPDTYPVAINNEAHIVSKCSSERTKRRAHLFTSHNEQKRLDNDFKNHRLDVSVETITEEILDDNGKVIGRKTITRPTQYTGLAYRLIEEETEKNGVQINNVLGKMVSITALILGIID